MDFARNPKAEGSLARSTTFSEQISRMLSDPQSDQFSKSFADQWLSLGTLGSMPPDTRGEYRVYNDKNLEAAMLEETRLLFRYMLHEMSNAKYRTRKENTGLFSHGLLTVPLGESRLAD